jgi:hypothetical protein
VHDNSDPSSANEPRILCSVRPSMRVENQPLRESTAHIYCLHIVFRSSREGTMTEEQLNATNVHALFEQVDRKGVANLMF